MNLAITIIAGAGAWYLASSALAASDAGLPDAKIVNGTYVSIAIGVVAALLVRKAIT